MTENKSERDNYAMDFLTVIALSVLAYTLAVLFHEYLGHGVACLTLGGHLSELGAYYVVCQYTGMTDINIRLVALAGPLVSLIIGALGLVVLDRIPTSAAHGRYWFWLFGTINLMTAAGYLLFSGFTGLGDFGTSRDGVLYQISPEWIWRVGLVVLGVAGYALVIYLSLRRMDNLIGGEGAARVRHAQTLALTSYLTGALMSVLVGLLNPHGLVIVLISAAASSLGGTSGLAWMTQLMDRKKKSTASPLQLPRNWSWIAAGFAVMLIYGLILGPTVRP
jgi:hypothetical protein